MNAHSVCCIVGVVTGSWWTINSMDALLWVLQQNASEFPAVFPAAADARLRKPRAAPRRAPTAARRELRRQVPCARALRRALPQPTKSKKLIPVHELQSLVQRFCILQAPPVASAARARCYRRCRLRSTREWADWSYSPGSVQYVVDPMRLSYEEIPRHPYGCRSMWLWVSNEFSKVTWVHLFWHALRSIYTYTQHAARSTYDNRELSKFQVSIELRKHYYLYSY